jgi:hypothetical protein
MNNRTLTKICLVLVVFISAGCQQKQEKEVDIFAREPNLKTISIPSDYASVAIEAAGGLETWLKTTELKLDCVITFYQPDGSTYLTEQHYNIYPWSNSIEISGKEPQGEIQWRLRQGQFEVLQGSGRINNSLSLLDSQCFAEAIVNIVTAPIRLMDKSIELTKYTNPVKVQGRWYDLITKRSKPNIELILRIPKAVFYQNRESTLIDMLWIACLGGDQFLTVRGYDYHEIGKGGVIIPDKIEIFSADSEGDIQNRLIKIDFM